jgi:hypothetical protein
MQAKTIRALSAPRSERFPDGVLPAGTIDDGPDSWRLVMAGVAEPADEECRAKCNLSREQMDTLQHAYDRLSLGIHPDDWAAFDAGEMIGYDERGRHIPGPNYCGGEADFEASAELDEEAVCL